MPHFAKGLIAMIWAIPAAGAAGIQIARGIQFERAGRKVDREGVWVTVVFLGLMALSAASITIWQWWG